MSIEKTVELLKLEADQARISVFWGELITQTLSTLARDPKLRDLSITEIATLLVLSSSYILSKLQEPDSTEIRKALAELMAVEPKGQF